MEQVNWAMQSVYSIYVIMYFIVMVSYSDFYCNVDSTAAHYIYRSIQDICGNSSLSEALVTNKKWLCIVRPLLAC